jgi:hypothetical protein
MIASGAQPVLVSQFGTNFVTNLCRQGGSAEPLSMPVVRWPRRSRRSAGEFAAMAYVVVNDF